MDIDNLYGLVMCGGQSSRMGTDKSRIIYYDKEQRYIVFDILKMHCKEVFLSCNRKQTQGNNLKCDVIEDDVVFSNTGPLGGLLTAFSQYPGKDFLIIGCDYPLISGNDVVNFLEAIPVDSLVGAFYNPTVNVYEPLIAFYARGCAVRLQKLYNDGQYSLQQFLKKESAFKFSGYDTCQVKSVDTPEEMRRIQKIIKNKENEKGN